MPLELRPAWCLVEETLDDLIELTPWVVDDGQLAIDQDGDHWSPGAGVRLSREVVLRVDPVELRQRLGLWPGAQVGIAGRWSCRTTFEGGAHLDGPSPLPLESTMTLCLDVPERIGGSLEFETCLVVKWTSDERGPNSCPDGAMVWSDSWSLGKVERTLLLEGSESRVPVRSVAFAAHFGRPSGALWAIDLDPSVSLEDLISNVVTVLLNREVLDRDFRAGTEEGDASRLPDSATAGIQVDLVRALNAALSGELEGDEDWREMEDGTVGAMIVRYLAETFESVEAGLANFADDEPSFNRELWHRFAPASWAV